MGSAARRRAGSGCWPFTILPTRYQIKTDGLPHALATGSYRYSRMGVSKRARAAASERTALWQASHTPNPLITPLGCPSAHSPPQPTRSDNPPELPKGAKMRGTDGVLHRGVVVEAGGNVRVVVGVGHLVRSWGLLSLSRGRWTSAQLIRLDGPLPQSSGTGWGGRSVGGPGHARAWPFGGTGGGRASGRAARRVDRLVWVLVWVLSVLCGASVGAAVSKWALWLRYRRGLRFGRCWQAVADNGRWRLSSGSQRPNWLLKPKTSQFADHIVDLRTVSKPEPLTPKSEVASSNGPTGSYGLLLRPELHIGCWQTAREHKMGVSGRSAGSLLRLGVLWAHAAHGSG